MKKVKLVYVIALVFFLPSVIMSSAYTRVANADSSEIVPPPSGATTISIPQTGNTEELAIPPQTTGNTETATTVQQPSPQQVPENIPPETGIAPTAEIPPLAPLSQPPAETPLAPVAGEALTPSTEPLPGVPPEGVQPPPEMPLAPIASQAPTPTTELVPAQQPASEAAPPPPEMPLAPAVSQTPAPAIEPVPAQQQAPAAIQPPSEMPMAPAAELSPTPTTTETMPPSAPQPAMEMPAAPTAQPEQAVPPAPVVSQPQNAPEQQTVTTTEIEKITKHPAIVPGEVLKGMPVYINTKTTHTVRTGEDLHWLAAEYYGNARMWTIIYDANKHLIKDPNHLVVGTKLVIPPKQ